MHECVNAFKIELPSSCLAEIDAIHEETRNPGVYMVDQHVWMTASWLGGAVGRACDVAGGKRKRAEPQNDSDPKKSDP